MKTIFTLIVMLCSGCLHYVYTDWTDLPDAPVRATLDKSYATNDRAQFEWDWQVEAAMRAWNLALEARGCRAMFRLAATADEAAYPIKLYPYNDWLHDDGEIGHAYGGNREQGRIDIRDRNPHESNVPTLIHELGHALGLGHVDDGVDSAMTVDVRSDVFMPTEHDVASVECR